MAASRKVLNINGLHRCGQCQAFHVNIVGYVAVSRLYEENILFYVWVSVNHKLIYIKNQREATWQYCLLVTAIMLIIAVTNKHTAKLHHVGSLYIYIYILTHSLP